MTRLEKIKDELRISLEHVNEAKKRWGPGPWHDEDDVDWFAAFGFPCLMRRNLIGTWCGYVGVPKDHVFYGKDYDEMPDSIEVHGGITYSDYGSINVPLFDEIKSGDEYFWFGFDCAHYGDLIPGMIALNRQQFGNFETYKDINFAAAETTKLAQQLADAEKETPGRCVSG